MFNIDRWQEIFDAIAKNKLRTFLTGVSVGSGIFILVVLLGVANGFNNGVKRKFGNDTTSLISFKAGKTTKEFKGLNAGRQIKMNTTDLAFIKKKYNYFFDNGVAEMYKAGLVSSFGTKSGTYIVRGVFPEKLVVDNPEILIGRFINHKDYEGVLKVAVLGIKVAKDLFESPYDCIGKTIIIGAIKYKVVGVYHYENDRQNNDIFVPYTLLYKLYGKASLGSDLKFTISPEDDYGLALQKSEAFAKQIKKELQTIHKVHPDDVTGIDFYNSVKGAKDIYDLLFGMRVFFWGIGVLTLVAGILGVSNIMLIIVKERTKEIGIRKALGALPNSIIGMILQESIFITFISGLLGLIFGFFVLEIIGKYIQTDFIYNPSVSFGIAISTVILLVIAGMLAGYFPARYAAKIKTIIALRDE